MTTSTTTAPATPRRLSQHFTLGELTRSDHAERSGIDNTPPPEVIHNLEALCIETLEHVRALFGGRAMHVSSGYRSAEVNDLAGGSKTSDHLKGFAADFEIPGLSNLAIALQIEKSSIPFDQLILEFHRVGEPSSGWVHISHRLKGDRRQVLTIDRKGTRPGLPRIELPAKAPR